ncbi:major facilitator superfamily domain-containing protein [Naematelia encephala]|uniref:Major facilitator superfamily domain-containing protein n=1 Tax=Naematelia encephala TaxID=71784 RepID=A0A1Y2BE16_9TREE|nr:major facilitator superfamily domain-containing protein [Naematelia encephala]
MDEKKDGYTNPAFVITEEALEHEVGLDLYRDAADLEYTPAEAKKVRRKIDAWILPMFCMCQGLAYLDKTGTNYGNLFGMRASLHVSTAQFAWFASAFYIGYLICAWPANLALQKYPTGKVMGIVTFFWGIVSVTPGLGLMTPLWWTLQEQPIRHLTWYCFNGVASIIGSLVAYGLGHATHSAVATWKLIFIVFGSFTSLWGIFIFIFLPDSPASAKFLTPEQRIIGVKRVAENRTGTKNTEFKWEQVREAFVDPKLYLLFVAAIAAQIPNGVVSNFSTIIIKGFGFTQLQTTLLDIPNSVVQISSLILSGFLAGRFKNSRAILMFVGNATCIVAACALTYAPHHETWGRLVAFWFTSFQSVGFSLSLVMISANIGGYTKRQTTNAITFIGYCIGNIAGPHVLLEREATTGYPTATKAMLAGYVVKTVTHLVLGAYMLYWNRRWDKMAIARGELLSEAQRRKLAEEVGMTDATEFNNPYFRYAL